MSKNDNVIRIWRGKPGSPEGTLFPHWHLDDGDWAWCKSGAVSDEEVFCLNDEEHPPSFVETTSLEGLLPDPEPEHNNFDGNFF